MMKVDIWMPLYIGDYLADTQRLTTEQHGAYLLLIMDYWRSGRPPDNDQVLAQICKLSPDAWCNAKAMLKQYFSIEDGCWVHKRIEAEILDAAQNQDRKHQRAVKGAAARWNKATNDASSNAQALPMQCPSPSPSPSPLPLTKPIKDNYGSPEGVSPEVWKDFVQQRKAKKAAITETAIKGIEREANKAGITLNAALQEICARGWTGFKAEWYTKEKQDGEPAWVKKNREWFESATGKVAEKDIFDMEVNLPRISK